MREIMIRIKWSESEFLHGMSIEAEGCNAKRFNSIFKFDHVLSLASLVAPKNGCYNKTTFIVDAAIEGKPVQYEGRIDLRHTSLRQETSTGVISTRQHIIDHCQHVCKATTWGSNQIAR